MRVLWVLIGWGQGGSSSLMLGMPWDEGLQLLHAGKGLLSEPGPSAREAGLVSRQVLIIGRRDPFAHLSSRAWLLQWAPAWKSLRIEGRRWPHQEAAFLFLVS